MKNKKISLILGAGGSRGLAHIGVLEVLQKAGMKIDLIVGSSMGAIIGAYFSLGFDLEKLEQEIRKFNKKKALKEIIDFTIPQKSLLAGKKFENYLKKIFGEKEFSQTKIPFIAAATDLLWGKEIFLKSGFIWKAVLASSAVPGIFPPVKFGEKYLVDGGVINPTPINFVQKFKNNLIIAVDFSIKDEWPAIKNPNIFLTLFQSYEIMKTNIVKEIIGKQENLVLIKPPLRSALQTFRFDNLGDFIDTGEEAAQKALPEILKKLK